MSTFVDLQVNGFAGVDFNADQLSDDEVLTATAALREIGGIDRCLVTLITAPWSVLNRRIAAWASRLDRLESLQETIAGLHIEGPFISSQAGFVGAHPADATRPATPSSACELLESGAGWIRMITLAPECDAGSKSTRYLRDQELIVAAGHSDASIDQLKQSIDAGLQIFTHLGNGCPAMLPRHDHIINRVLSLSEHLTVSFIADGHHVPWLALRTYLQVVPATKVLIVSDAIAAAGLGAGRFQLGHHIFDVKEDLSTWSADGLHLTGCATTMPQMASLLKERLSVSDEQIETWMIHNPRRMLGA